MDQQWKDIPGYEELYQVSDMGHIRGLKPSPRLKGTYLIPVLHNGKYHRVRFFKEGKRKSFFIHILVGKAFVPNPLNLTEINHKKGNKLDNRASELEWTTRQNNILHSYRVLGTKSKGRSYPCCRLKPGYFSVI
jgi:hypothetical protein